MVTRYGDLLLAARANLDTALVRTRHPAAHPDPSLPGWLADVAGALAHLGTTLGPAARSSGNLLAALRATARSDLTTPAPSPAPAGTALDLAEAGIAIRVAADLLASHGPPAAQMTARDRAGEWASPRPEHLTSRAALQGAWAQIADLAELISALARQQGAEPHLAVATDRLAAAAAAVPRRTPDPAIQAAGPAWPLPLPRRPIPDEWAGRCEEVTALAWRMTQAPGSGRAPQIHAMRLLAETGYLLHVQASRAATATPNRLDLHQRAQLWRAIHRQLHTIHTPTEPLMPAQEFALLRTRALASGPLEPADLLTGITVWSQVARWAPATLAHLEDNPLAGIGPTLTAELTAHLRPRTGARPTALNRDYEAVLLAGLNHRTTSPIPAGALAPVAALYQAAAAPPTQPPPNGRSTRHLAAIPTPPAAAPASRHPTTGLRR